MLKQSIHAAAELVPFAGGAACWSIFFAGLPKPMWLYVVGHELTHVISAWISGVRVRSIVANKRGGHVVLSGSNAFIALSPYFFPFYAVLWSMAYSLARLLSHNENLTAWFYFGLGAAYAFHVTLTVHILRMRQPDIEGEGRILSAMIIWLGNVLVALVGLSLMTRCIGLADAAIIAIERTGQIIAIVGALGLKLIA